MKPVKGNFEMSRSNIKVLYYEIVYWKYIHQL